METCPEMRFREGAEGGGTKDETLVPDELCGREWEEAGESSQETLVDQDVVEVSDDGVLSCRHVGKAFHVWRRGVLEDV